MRGRDAMGVVALYEQWKRRRLALTLGLALGVLAKPLAELVRRREE